MGIKALLLATLLGSKRFKQAPEDSRRFKRVSRGFQEGFKRVSRWFQDGFKMVSRWFQEGFK